MKALILPAYRPSDALVRLVESIPRDEFAVIVAVDDGSGPESSGIFEQLRELGVLVVTHATRVGEGAAARAGMHRALEEGPALDSIVLAQETDRADQIASVSRRHDALTLAAPPRSRSDVATRLLTGIKVSDPWASPRSIPANLVPHLLLLESRGPEFHLEALVAAAEHSVPIVEERIERQRTPSASAVWPLIRFLALVRPDRAITRFVAALTFVLLVAAIAGGIYGFATGHLFDQFIWLPWGQRRFFHFGALFGAVSLPLMLIFPWAYAPLFAAVLLGATALATGPLAVLAVLFFLLSANVVGRAALERLPLATKKPENSELFFTLVGIGIYALLMTLTARIPVNYGVVWAAVLALPIALNARGTVVRVRRWLAALGSIELPTWRVRGAFALLLAVLSIHWFAAIEPESSADGLTMHLAIAADIAAHHAMTFHPSLFVWSVMPMAADFSYTIVYLLGGEAATGLLNFALLLALAALLFRAAREWLPTAPALVATALFASTPLVHLVTGSLFIENFVAVMIFGMVMALWRYHDAGGVRNLWFAAALGGTAASAKFGACAFVLVALAFAVFELRRRRARKPALIAAGLLLAFAAPPYLIAFARTGNPVFPFLNGKFPSPLLQHGVEFRNNAFTQALSWNTPFDLAFHTDRYLEGLKGAFGFQYLFLIPLAAVALFAARSYAARLAGAVALVAGAIVMSSQPYARYVYPAMPLLVIPFALFASRFIRRQPRLYTALFAAALGCIALNAYFAPVSGWYHKDFYAPAVFRPGGRTRVIHENLPLRDVTIRYRQAHPQGHVLLLVEQDLADVGSSAYEYHWHQHSVFQQIATSDTAAALRHLFSRLGIRDFISRRAGPDDDLLSPPALSEFLATCTTPLIENGRDYAAHITAECEKLSDADLEAKLEYSPPALVYPGSYDDFDPSFRFRGAWTRSHGFTGPYRHTISYTDSPGAEAAFAFEGSALTYIFTKANNRGIANLEIDGTAHEIDLYAPTPEWQNRLEFCCLGQGRHLVVLHATGRKREEAKDDYIDVDGFIAR